MKDQHRLARLLSELEDSESVDTEPLRQAWALLKKLTRKERRRLLSRFSELVERVRILLFPNGNRIPLYVSTGVDNHT
jgi:hypothetical protein